MDGSLIHLPTGTERRALHLKGPHGALIADGRKTQIAKAKPFDLHGPWVLVSDGKAFGTVDVGLPEPVTREQFDERFDEHRVLATERERWWPEVETFYLSPLLQVEPFEHPYEIVVQPSMQTVVEELEFASDTPDLEAHFANVRKALENDGPGEVEAMPYDPSNPPEKVRKLSPEKQRQWVHVFNSCMENGGDEASCHKQAWGVANKEAEDDKALGEGQGVGGPRQGEGGVDQCTCPECGTKAAHERGTPCAEEKCPKCGAPMRGVAEAPAEKAANGRSAFLVFDGKDGRKWLATFTTNAFVDREHEVFKTKAIDDYIARHANQDVKGGYWFWHVPGTKFADITWQGRVGRFLLEAGPFDDTGVGRKFASFFSAYPDGHPSIAPEGWGTSHGYWYALADRKDQTYDWFEKFESTVLPFGAASNQHSPRMEELTKMNAEQKAALETICGADLAQALIDTGQRHTDELEQKGVTFKAMPGLPFPIPKKAEVVEEEDEEAPKVEKVAEEEKAVESEVVEDDAVETATDVKAIAEQLVAQLGLGELVEGIKQRDEIIGQLNEQLTDLSERMKSLEDMGVDEHAPVPNLTRNALFRASQAAQTAAPEGAELSKKSAPSVPSAIAAMANKVPL